MFIRGYQRFISPHKGFRCAYGVHTGCASCSALGFRAIRRHGVLAGLQLLSRRFDRCAEARRQLQTLARRPRFQTQAQAGFADCGGDCGDCSPDCSPGDCDCDVFDALDCLDCGDWPSRKDKRSSAKRPARVPFTQRSRTIMSPQVPSPAPVPWSDTMAHPQGSAIDHESP